MYDPFNPNGSLNNGGGVNVNVVPQSPTNNYMSFLLPRTQLKYINGEQGAVSFKMGANSTDSALDTTGPYIWFFESDQYGNQIKRSRCRLIQEEPEPEPTLKDLEAKFTSFKDDIKTELTSEIGDIVAIKIKEALG